MTSQAPRSLKVRKESSICDLPSAWSLTQLKFVARFQYGDSLSADRRVSGPFRVFGSNGPVGTHEIANTVAPCIVIGRKGSFGKVTWSESRCFAIDTTFFVDSTTTSHNLRWLFYCIQWLRLDSYSRDSAVPGLTREYAYSQYMPVCSPREQQAIADFLDRETERIDTLIEKKQRQIELLKEKRTALISHAVTKGLNPDTPMKDSGIEWLGEIPAHWETYQLRRVVAQFVDYRGRTPRKTEGGVPLITARNIKDGRIDFSQSAEFMAEDEYDEWMVRGRPSKGDVLVTTEAPLGEVAQVQDTNVALAQRIILLKVNNSMVTGDYLKYYYLSLAGKSELQSYASGSTATGIRADRFRGSAVVVPPLQEQEMIVDFVDSQILDILRPMGSIERSLQLLSEYRSALISAAVTGKINVQEGERA